MTRICFVGNSHLAAIKLGWDATSDGYPDLHASFFGAPAAGMSHMAPSGDGYLVSSDKAATARLRALWGTDRFRPDDYDVLCLVGMGMSPRVLARLYGQFRSSAHRNRTGNFRLLSPDCFQEAANGELRTMVGARLLTRLRQVSQRPVVVAAQAAPCATAGDEQAQRRWLNAMLACGDDRILFDTFIGALRHLGANFIVPQPVATQLNLFATKPEYAEGSQRLNPSFSEREDDNTNHMNAAYGALVVRDVCQLLRREGLTSKRAAQPAAPALEVSA
jgi:hypothetical protein